MTPTFREALEKLIDHYITERGCSAQSILDALQNAELDMRAFMIFDETAVKRS
jgi:hypothetical protein